VFGFLPPSSHLVLRPDRVTSASFVDASPHRAELPPAYNSYALADSDPAFDRDREAQQMVLRPLFFLSFLLADLLDEQETFRACVAIISSASSKASLGTAFLLSRMDVPTIGLTSGANLGFVEDLGLYEHVVSYDEIEALDVEPSVYLDLSGDLGVRQAVHSRYGDALRHSAIVGQTHWEDVADEPSPAPGPTPTFFFAPDRIRKRTRDWGRRGLEDRMERAWLPFVEWTDGWLVIVSGSGPEAIERAYREVLEGCCAPSTAHVLRPQERFPDGLLGEGPSVSACT
jgi:hypothetical protein